MRSPPRGLGGGELLETSANGFLGFDLDTNHETVSAGVTDLEHGALLPRPDASEKLEVGVPRGNIIRSGKVDGGSSVGRERDIGEEEDNDMRKGFCRW